MDAEAKRNDILKDIQRRMFEKFSKHYTMWKTCIELVATLDVLTALAVYGQNQNQEICFPEMLPSGETGPIIEIANGYHPCMKSTDDFIPNGMTLGNGGGGDGGSAPLALLTGPNMGGKSTLMRQMGLLVIMAQIGAPIPAESARMTVVDRIFTRLGAQDDIMAGHSTFLVELSETSAILKHATVNSLVLLDELGRGTATYDGTAIAAAVVNYLADLKCLTMFSTHYHSLVDNFHVDPRITLGHMACMVENEGDTDDPTEETVTFLYKYSAGACPKSYGFNAAKLAGMPKSIIKRAHEVSETQLFSIDGHNTKSFVFSFNQLSKDVESRALQQKIFAKIATKADLNTIKDLLVKLKACSL